MGLLKVATVHNKVTMLEQRGEAASRVHGSIATAVLPATVRVWILYFSSHDVFSTPLTGHTAE